MAACALAPLSSRAETLLLKNATVHPVTGPTLMGADVLVDGGKISQIAPHIDALADHTIDLTGQHLYPGLVDLDTPLGLEEIEAVRATLDLEDVGQFIPEVGSWVAVNPDSELIAVARANGIGYFEATPQGTMVAGRSGLMAMDGWTTESMVFKKPAALHVYWPNMNVGAGGRRGGGGGGRRRGAGIASPDEQVKERQKKIKELADYFLDAKAYDVARSAAKTNGAPDPGENPSWEAMRPYVRGDAPIIVHADDVRQIKAALKWADTNKYRIVIAGARDAWKVGDLLAKQDVPVIYGGTYTLPSSESDGYDIHFKAPEILHKAGVKVIISMPEGGESADPATLAKNLPYTAASAVAYGLPADEALKAITLYPAQIMGVSEQIGSIETGKVATLFSCTGDIMDLRANVTHLWVAGHSVSLESRHTRLYDKYRNRPKPQ